VASVDSLPQHSAHAHAPRDARRRAVRELIAWGLVVVPYSAPAGRGGRAGKAPLSDGAGGRVECHTPEQFGRYLERVPALNTAILGVAQVDAHSPEAIDKARDLGVTSAARRLDPARWAQAEILCPTEESVFELLSWPWVDPEERTGTSALELLRPAGPGPRRL